MYVAVRVLDSMNKKVYCAHMWIIMHIAFLKEKAGRAVFSDLTLNVVRPIYSKCSGSKYIFLMDLHGLENDIR